mmetsp:Transcript_23639/g.52418  ORF Transcript_23639/g.52418 Transcript_23639/m.52418 type:complete len:269 (-) Transcript_23639:119-925(-)
MAIAAPLALGATSRRFRHRRVLCKSALAAPALLLASLFLAGARLFVSPGSLQKLRSTRAARCASSSLQVEGDVVPLGRHVLVRIDEPEEVTKGGILLPRQDRPKEGVVAAIGPGEANLETGTLVPVSVKPGVKVMYTKYSGSDTLECGGAEHTLIREDDILLSYEGDSVSVENLRMPRGRLLVRLIKAKETTDGGLLLSKGAAEKSTTVGEVIAVGEGELLANGEVAEPQVQVGDMVRFRYGDEVDLDVGDDRFTSVRLSSCIAKWKA